MTHIAEFYTHDHDVLDENFKCFQKLKMNNYPLAKVYFQKFLFGLKRHIVWEEEILFPLFEEKTGMKDAGPTAAMRLEHLHILAALDSLHHKIRRYDIRSEVEEELLINLLKEHNDKEEKVLYPAIDRLATEEERKSVFAGMQKMPEAGSGCGGGSCRCH